MPRRSEARRSPAFLPILCWAAYGTSYLGRMNLAIAIPSMRAAGVATLGELGLVGSLYFWCYGCGHLVNGALGDRIDPRLMVFGGLLLSSLMNLAVTLAPTPALIMVFWSLNGFFLSMLWGPMIRLLGEEVAESRQGLVSLLMTASIGAGSFAAWLALGRAVEAMREWRYAFWIPSIACGACSLAWLALCPRRSARAGGAPAGRGAPAPGPAAPREGFRGVFLRSRLYLVVLAVMVQGMIKDGLTLWLPTLIRSRFPGESAGAIVDWLSLVPFVNAAGILLFALVLRRREIDYRKSTILCFAGAAALLALLALVEMPMAPSLGLLSLLSVSIAFVNSILLGMVPMRFKRSGRVSTVAGLLDFVAYLAAGAFSLASGLFFRGGGWGGVFGFLLAGVLVGAAVMIPAPGVIDE